MLKQLIATYINFSQHLSAFIVARGMKCFLKQKRCDSNVFCRIVITFDSGWYWQKYIWKFRRNDRKITNTVGEFLQLPQG